MKELKPLHISDGSSKDMPFGDRPYRVISKSSSPVHAGIDNLNILSNPLIRVQIGGNLERMTLPQIYAAMAKDQISAFPALRPHQNSAWHMFLVQLGSLALHKAGLTDLPDQEKDWSKLFRGLTLEYGDAPWELVVEDLAKPAFFQPPVPEETLDAFKPGLTAPDALDFLVTSKNFDIKSNIAFSAEVDDWLFSLISLQTMDGFMGAGNFGIARMNGGFSTRPFFGIRPKGGFGSHVFSDIKHMLQGRQALLEKYSFYSENNGLGLLWLIPWDGKESLDLRTFDPWFIEICRRVRFVITPKGALVARTRAAKGTRVEAKHINGVTGDFWAPVNIAEAKAVSLDNRGFSAKFLSDILFPASAKKAFELPPSFTTLHGKEDMQLVCRGVVRGQGKTEGFFERTIPLKGKLKRSLLSPKERETAGSICERQLKEISQISSALRFGCAIAKESGSTEKIRPDHYNAATPYLHRFSKHSEAVFFACLYDRLEHGEAAKGSYLRDLIKEARKLLEEAINSVPCASLRRPRARVRAEKAFFGKLWGEKSPLAADKDLIMESNHEA